MKFLIHFLFAIFISANAIARDVSLGKKQSSSKSKAVAVEADKCPTTLVDWVEDDFKDKRAIYSWPMKSEAKTCQMNINSYGKSLAADHNLDDYLSEKFKDKINPEYKNYFSKCDKLPIEKQSAVKVRFYESSTKLEAASSSTIDEIAAIDAYLPGVATLEGVECSRVWPKILEKCEASKKMAQECSSSKQARLEGLVKQTQETLPQIEALVEAHHACLQKNYSVAQRTRNGFPAEIVKKIKDTCDPINVEINRLSDSVPWVRGETFLKVATRKKASPRNAKFTTDYDLSAETIKKAITEQLTLNRKAYVKAYQTSRDDFSCLADKTGSSHCDFKDLRSRLLAMPDLRQNPFDLKQAKDKEANSYFEAETCLLSRGEDRERSKAKINGPIGIAAQVGAFVALSVASGFVADIVLAPRAITAGMSLFSRIRSTVAGVKNLTSMQQGTLLASGISEAYTVGAMGTSIRQACSSEIESLVAKQRPSDLMKENVCPDLNGTLAQAKQKETSCLLASALAIPSIVPFVGRATALIKVSAQAKHISGLAAKKGLPPLKGVYDEHPQKVLDLARYERDAKYFPAGSPEAKKFFNEMDDGTYVYLIDAKGNVAFINREMKPRPGDNMEQNLGNHGGLAKFLEAKTGEKSELVAAGEYVKRIKDSAVIDQAGSLRGAKENLDHAKEVMQTLGAPAELKAIRVVDSVGNYIEPHTKAAQEVKWSLEFAADPQIKKVVDETREVMKKVTALPDSEVMRRWNKELAVDFNDDSLTDVAFVYAHWKNLREGEMFTMNYIMRRGEATGPVDFVRYQNMLTGLKKIADQK